MDEKTLKYLDPNFKDSREKIESLEQIIYRLNKYIRSPEELNESFLAFLTQAITKILQHPIVSGQKGDELASDLIFRCTKLYIHFIEKGLSDKKSVATLLFNLIDTIFNEYYNNSFFVTKEKDKNTIKGTHKELTYEDYNKFFQSDFEKKAIDNYFQKEKIVDIYYQRKIQYDKIYKYEWTRGKVLDITEEGDKKEYIIKSYITLGSNSITPIRFPSKTNRITNEGVNTEYLYKRLNKFVKDKKVDIYIDKDKEKIWCPGIIIDDGQSVQSDDKDFKYVIYKVDNNINNYNDNNDNNMYEEKESMEFPYDSYKIQKYRTYSDVQKKYFKMSEDKKYDSVNNYKDLLNFTNEILENDQNIETLYEYKAYDSEDNNKKKKNYIIGKYEKNYSFYFSKLLKAMADNNYFKTLIYILRLGDKDYKKKKLNRANPTLDEIKTIFCILINCHAFIHKEYFKKYYNVFEGAVMRLIENENEKNNLRKKDFDFFIFFLVKIKYIINTYNFDFSLSEQINELYLKFGIKMFMSKVYNVRDIGLNMILECVNYSLDDEENKKILNILDTIEQKEEKNFIEILFENYNTGFITKSYCIIGLMFKKLTSEKKNIELIWQKVNENKSDSDLEKAVIKLFEYLLHCLEKQKEFLEKQKNTPENKEKLEECDELLKNFSNNLLEIIPKQNNDDLYMLRNKLASKGNENEEEQIKCCEYFTEKILKEEDLNNLKNNDFLKETIYRTFKKRRKNSRKYFINIFSFS